MSSQTLSYSDSTAAHKVLNYKYDMSDILFTNKFSLTSDIPHRIVTRSVTVNNSAIYRVEEAEHPHNHRVWVLEVDLYTPEFKLDDNLRLKQMGDSKGKVVRITLARNEFFYDIAVESKTWQGIREGISRMLLVL